MSHRMAVLNIGADSLAGIAQGILSGYHRNTDKVIADNRWQSKQFHIAQRIAVIESRIPMSGRGRRFPAGYRSSNQATPRSGQLRDDSLDGGSACGDLGWAAEPAAGADEAPRGPTGGVRKRKAAKTTNRNVEKRYRASKTGARRPPSKTAGASKTR